MSNEKIVIITGANSGIGKAAALRFARDGWTVVMACRSAEKAAAARDEIVRATGNDRVETLSLDMSSRAAIHDFAEAVQEKHPRVDVLIHNAAYFNHGEAFKLGPDGVEVTFATNVAGPFLLTRLLLPALKRSGDPRVLHAGSNIVKHFFNPKKTLDLDYLNGVPEGVRAPKVYDRYAHSKMALLMLTFAMATRLAADGVAVNCLQINGAKMSKDTLRKFSWRYRVVAWIQNLFFPPAEYMANAYFAITTSQRFRGVTGKYVNEKLGIMQPAAEDAGVRQQIRQLTGTDHYPRCAEDAEMQQTLWRICESFTDGGPVPRDLASRPDTSGDLEGPALAKAH